MFVLALVEELADGEPEAVGDEGFVLVEVEVLGPFLYGVLVAALPASVILYFCFSSCLK